MRHRPSTILLLLPLLTGSMPFSNGWHEPDQSGQDSSIPPAEQRAEGEEKVEIENFRVWAAILPDRAGLPFLSADLGHYRLTPVSRPFCPMRTGFDRGPPAVSETASTD